MQTGTSRIAQRQELLDRLLAGFSARPEVFGMYTFGGAVDGHVDQYSDIDLMVCTADLPDTASCVDDVFESIAPIRARYHIRCDESRHAQMILLEGYSPYQKVDFSIADAPSPELAPFATLYDARSKPSGDAGGLTYDGQRDSLANQLNDLLFAVPRFTKCLFRRDRDMYRRWTGTVETLMSLLYEHHFGWRPGWPGRLGPHEYKRLHSALSGEFAQIIDRVQPLDGRPDVVKSYRFAVELCVRLHQARAAAMGEPVDSAFAEWMLRFLDTESERYGLPRR